MGKETPFLRGCLSGWKTPPPGGESAAAGAPGPAPAAACSLAPSAGRRALALVRAGKRAVLKAEVTA